MSNILLVEPNYRSKFPPLGLLRIATFHKSKGDHVTFVRGKDQSLRALPWHRIYVSSLFTWELPRTVSTIRFYNPAVRSAGDIYVGGPAVTLFPDYVRSKFPCTIVAGILDGPGRLGPDSPAIAELTPDYGILDNFDYRYHPTDCYYVKITKGCVRKCRFCAVPLLENKFGFVRSVNEQIKEVDACYGPKQHLMIMDNNILGSEKIDNIIKEIVDAGFHAGAKRDGRLRTVDFNQGLDARMISRKPSLAALLATTCVNPIRLAYDFIPIRKSYERAIRVLADCGFREFTNYMLFNFDDSPKDFFQRLWLNAYLNQELGIRITGFPMRFIPMRDVKRSYISKHWKWKYLRGIQCVLLATRGLVSPNPAFLKAAFGDTYEDFLEILAMPDQYIIYRDRYRENQVPEWREMFRRLTPEERDEFLSLLEHLNKAPQRAQEIKELTHFKLLINHYYSEEKASPWDQSASERLR